MFEPRRSVTIDTFQIKIDVENAIKAHERELITDKEFIDVVKDTMHRNSNLVIDRD